MALAVFRKAILSLELPFGMCLDSTLSKGTYMLQRRKPQKTTSKGLKDVTKKAVLLKNCFVTLNPNIENSIDCQKAPEGEPVQSAAKDLTGFHLVSCGQDESLVIRRRYS
jgi:hypothetical protein